MNRLFSNKKKVFIWFVFCLLVCLSFYFIYIYFSPNKEICTLNQIYPNYKNNIKVTIIGNQAIIEERFNSNDKYIREFKYTEYRNRNYYVTITNNILTATKKIDKSNLVNKYLESGFNCDGEVKDINVEFSIKEDSNKLEVNNSYKSELLKASINDVDYSGDVILKDRIDTNTLGKHVVSYRLKVGDMRYDYIYKVIDVVDDIPPVILLNGTGSYDVIEGTSYKEEGYKVKDNYDSFDDIKLKIDNNVDISTPGVYKIIYTAIDSSLNKTVTERIITVREKNDYLTYINGILVINKKYSVPKDYGSGIVPIVNDAYNKLASDASKLGYDIPLKSGYRTYDYQNKIYTNYSKIYGKEVADTFSAQPGHSEHQSGLAMDVGKIDDDYGNTPPGKWLKDNAHKYGFIIRYPKEKENITGYKYEPWHIRYLGIDTATKVYNSGLTLEEYLKIS